MPKLIAATADGKIASAIPLAACATTMGQNCGTRAITAAAMATAVAPIAINVRFQRTASTSAPPGPRARTVATPAIVSTTPMRPASQCWLDIRKMARNGPRPSLTSARKKLSQSGGHRLAAMQPSRPGSMLVRLTASSSWLGPITFSTDQGRGGGEPGSGGGGAAPLGAAVPAAGGGGGGATLAAGGGGGGAAANAGEGGRRPFLPPLSRITLYCIPAWPMVCTSMTRPRGVTR